jgi:hypothetical protein
MTRLRVGVSLMTDWEFVHDEVAEALHTYREWQFDHDCWPAHDVIEQLGQALLALAEQHGLSGTYVYGKEK